MEKLFSTQPIDINVHNATEMRQVLPYAPSFSSRMLELPGLMLEQYNHPAHEAPKHYMQQHVVAVTLSEQVEIHHQIENEYAHSLMRRGDLIIHPAGFQRWCVWEKPAEFLLLSIDQSTLAEALYQTGDTRQLELVPQLQIRDRVVEHLITNLASEIQTNSSKEPLYIHSLLHLLYFHLLRHHSTSNLSDFPEPSHPSKRILLEAIEYMQANLHCDANSIAPSPSLDITSYELTLLFLDLTGLTPYQYLMRCRIERAKQLLTNKHLSISEIATQVGFATIHQLNTQFLQLVGVTPKIYRAEFAL